MITELTEDQSPENMIKTTETEWLTTEFPLSEKDEVAMASLRTRRLYEEYEKLNERSKRDGKEKQSAQNGQNFKA